MATTTPPYLIHNGLWTLLEAKSHFTDLVKPGNRRKVVASLADLLKEDAKPADYPEVAVLAANSDIEDRGFGENETGWTLFWEVLVSTGMQGAERFFDVQFSVLRALLGWDTTLKALTWQSVAFVVDCNLLTTKDSILNQYLNRDIKGWSSVWRGSTFCTFNHTTLTA